MKEMSTEEKAGRALIFELARLGFEIAGVDPEELGNFIFDKASEERIRKGKDSLTVGLGMVAKVIANDSGK